MLTVIIQLMPQVTVLDFTLNWIEIIVQLTINTEVTLSVLCHSSLFKKSKLHI